MKTKITIILTCLLILCAYCNTVAAQSTYENVKIETDNDSSYHQTRADDIRWRYKSIKGNTYRRLFNYTQRKWIGEWEPV